MSRPGLALALLALLGASSCQSDVDSGPVTGEVTGTTASAASTHAAEDSETSDGAPTSTAAPLPPLETLPSDRFSLQASGSIELVAAPAALLHAEGALWVQDHRGWLITKMDPETGELLGQAKTGLVGCGDLVHADGGIWWTGCRVSPGMVKLDPESLEVVEQVPELGLGPTEHQGGLWRPVNLLGDTWSAALQRVPLDAPGEATFVPVPGLRDGEAGAISANGSLWVTDRRSAIVYEVDADAGTVLAAVPMPTPAGSVYLVKHDDAPLFYDAQTGRIVTIDPRTREARMLNLRLEKPHEYWGVAASSAEKDEGHLWVRSGDGEVWLVDTRQDVVLRRIAVDPAGGGGDVQQIGDKLWVSGFASQSIERIALEPGGPP